MPALPNRVLFEKLRAALPSDSVFVSAENQIHPSTVNIPRFGRARFYLWTITPDRSAEGARPAGEFKIQLILPDQPRESRGSLDLSEIPTFLLGYSPDFGVFVGWEARLYDDFAFSANVQTREELLSEGRSLGWAVAAPRRRRETEEVRVAFSPGNLLHYLRASVRADREKLYGRWREAFFLSQTPNVSLETLPSRASQLLEYVEQERRRVSATRAQRDARFGPRVREQFDFSCALCRIQLEIIESAHIIPVCEPESRDDLWNGVALCPNHHKLFDARTFVIDRTLHVRVDRATVQFLIDSRQDEGIAVLTDFDGRLIRRPTFWNIDENSQRRMVWAFDRRAELSGLGQ